MPTKYQEIHPNEIPPGACFDVPGVNRGQIVEIAYSTGRATDRHEACHGDKYKRVTDQSYGEGNLLRVKYYERIGGRK